jgi:hypothetical protein
VLLAAVCESQSHAWNDEDIFVLLNFRLKSLTTGRRSKFLTSILDQHNFQPFRRETTEFIAYMYMSLKFKYHNVPLITLLRDMFDIVVRKNVLLSQDIVCYILDSRSLTIRFTVTGS